jgi:hypothetical protein
MPMPSFDKVLVEIDEHGMVELARSPEIRNALLDIADARVARPAQARAPKRTGFGASTIGSEASLAGTEWEVNTSWSQDAFYLKFHELGDRYMRADPFLVPTEGFE